MIKLRWLLLALILLFLFLLLWPQRAVNYRFLVVNQSGQAVRQISLLDSALSQPVVLNNLLNGEQVELVVELLPQGVLRFQLEQGQNRLDGIVEADVSRLQRRQRQLTIHPNNRLILSELD